MQVFWKTEPLTPEQTELLDALMEAHHASAFRVNPSTVAVQNAAYGSGDVCKAMASAILSLGGVHGPVEATYDFLVAWNSKNHPLLAGMVAAGVKIPGWGSSFSKDKSKDPTGDPIWERVEKILEASFPDLHSTLVEVTGAMLDLGKHLYPNPSAFTAAAAIALEMPKELSPCLLISGRMGAWAELFWNQKKGK